MQLFLFVVEISFIVRTSKNNYLLLQRCEKLKLKLWIVTNNSTACAMERVIVVVSRTDHLNA